MEKHIVPKNVQGGKMQILGHPLIEFRYLQSISSKEEIEETQDDHILLFEYDAELIRCAKELKKDFALHIFNKTEAIIGNAVQAKILICPEKYATQMQELAEYYLFDAKIAILINNEEEINLAIEKKVDMAILSEAIK